jgi:hypothetical protein
MAVTFRAIKIPPPSLVDDFTHVLITMHNKDVQDCPSPAHEAPIINTLVKALKSLGTLIITR